jgi:hypothetical protein
MVDGEDVMTPKKPQPETVFVYAMLSTKHRGHVVNTSLYSGGPGFKS